MALEGVFLQHDNIFNYNGKEAYSNIYTEDEPHFYDLQDSLGFLDSQTENYNSTFLQEDYYENTTTFLHQPLPEIAISEANITANRNSSGSPNCDRSYHRDSETNTTRNKKATRRRTRVKKNKEDINNQRMTHIAVERNRRKLMNEYLSVLRSLMPDSYVQRCDQASIVGGSINFIRELENRLHLLNANKEQNENSLSCRDITSATPFSDAFKLPQISMGSSTVSENVVFENALADIEVSLVECHASLKIRSRRRPKILLNLVSGLQSLGFIILHLNVSTVSDFILYCFSTKMEDYCKLDSVADISTAVHEILRIHDDGQQ
ncbi:Myc-type basic helix-loop-helix (bHLH) domain [Arabidopsis thaliana x Arabidopsis arenosa]|uniref:Myc-type basic helix-loop-helix (BHLH) domain n=1 Tax=Arabidopsis thaliana x Arabidopsis arenosa TaxID=1240361 RepID=A0A8T2BE65_9BRAS|nr:Myc-type basic helix-loop-helix (bHLH) domain [Arabidopsis thaliana x Arabidopsis arenosa]